MKLQMVQELIDSQKKIEEHKKKIREMQFDFGDQLRKFRLANKIKVRDFVKELGISIPFYYDMEKGFRKPNVNILAKLEALM